MEMAKKIPNSSDDDDDDNTVKQNIYQQMNDLHDERTFIADTIKTRVSSVMEDAPIINPCFLLYWFYLITLGRLMEPAKFHLFQTTYNEVKTQYLAREQN